MIKKPVFFFVAVVCVAVTVPHAAVAAPCRASDQDAIRHIADVWRDGYNQGHAAEVAGLYTQDAYYLTQHFVTGIVHGRADVQAYVQRGVNARYHIDSISVLKMACSRDFAYAIARYESTNHGQRAFGFNLLVLQKVGKDWLIAAHESAVPDPATAIKRLD